MMVCSTHPFSGGTWWPFRRRSLRRPPWRKVLAALLATAATVAVLSEVLRAETEKGKHSSRQSISRSIVANRPQEKTIFNRNLADSSEKLRASPIENMNLLQKWINYENSSNNRYTNVILSHLEDPMNRSEDTINEPRKRGVESILNELTDGLNPKEMREAEHDFSLRRKKVRETCAKYGLGKYKASEHRNALRYPPTANYDVLFIDRRDGFTYCPVYKVASTTWLHYLSQLAGADPKLLNSTSLQISTIARRLWPQLDYDEASLVVPATLKFMLVRHPFERIVSAYRDKLENINIGREHGVLHFYESYGKKIVHKYRQKNATIHRVRLDEDSHLPAPSGVEPTFQEFVRYLTDTDLVHHADDHWMPYYLFCTPCYIEYDVIAHFHSLERDQKYVLQKLKLNKNLQRPQWKHLTKGKKSSVIVEKYLNTLSKVEKYKLYEKYKIDFEMFSFQL